MKRPILIGLVAGAVAFALLALMPWPPRVAPREVVVTPVPGHDGAWEELVAMASKPRPKLATTRPAPTGPSAQQALDRIIATVDFRETPLDKAIDTIRDETGANLVVRWQALEGAGVDKTAPANLRLHDLPGTTVLRELLATFEPANLAFAMIDEIVVVSTADEFNLDQRFAVLRLYDIRDLLVNAARFSRAMEGPPTTRPSRIWPQGGSGSSIFGTFQSYSLEPEYELVNELRSLIQGSFALDSWVDNGGRIGSVRYWGGWLAVRQTRDVQEQIARLLDALRQEQLMSEP